MKQELEAIRAKALEAIGGAEKAEDLEALRVQYLGKRGELTAVLKQMGSLSAEERPVIGQLANEVRAKLEESVETRAKELAAKALEMKLKAEAVDVTIPGKAVKIGKKHPMYQVLDEIKDIFVGMGFEILEDREVETADYNFTKLNCLEGHPAREWTDTFYFTEDSSILLRTQTSPMQIHAMETRSLPIRILAPGRVYRKDEVDATHSPMFHQIEGMVIDKGVTMADLKGTLNAVMEELYGKGTGHALPPAPLPLHRAELRDGHPVPQVPRRGLPDLQGRGLDRGPRRGHGASQGARGLRHRLQRVFRLGVRHGSGASGARPLQDRRPASDLRKRRPVPGAVLRKESEENEFKQKLAQRIC